MSAHLLEAAWTSAAPNTPDSLDDRIFVTLEHHRRIRVFLKDIKFVEARRSYCRLVTRTGDFLLSLSMASFLRQLPEGYLLKVHRSFLINLEWVEEIDTGCMVIDKVVIPISESARRQVHRALHIIG